MSMWLGNNIELPSIQSNTNLGVAGKVFCRCGTSLQSVASKCRWASSSELKGLKGKTGFPEEEEILP